MMPFRQLMLYMLVAVLAVTGTVLMIPPEETTSSVQCSLSCHQGAGWSVERAQRFASVFRE
ncbi:hypothetical protein [Teichococcus vastitatis]|uniref:hypothetical protein n=1 Tax=Teichococcus vastitatis TaxID=2307076 RepID=UPI0013008351|nr:hypothetical protein [Pseudoroseomonas vastitatis]